MEVPLWLQDDRSLAFVCDCNMPRYSVMSDRYHSVTRRNLYRRFRTECHLSYGYSDHPVLHLHPRYFTDSDTLYSELVKNHRLEEIGARVMEIPESMDVSAFVKNPDYHSPVTWRSVAKFGKKLDTGVEEVAYKQTFDSGKWNSIGDYLKTDKLRSVEDVMGNPRDHLDQVEYVACDGLLDWTLGGSSFLHFRDWKDDHFDGSPLNRDVEHYVGVTGTGTQLHVEHCYLASVNFVIPLGWGGFKVWDVYRPCDRRTVENFQTATLDMKRGCPDFHNSMRLATSVEESLEVKSTRLIQSENQLVVTAAGAFHQVTNFGASTCVVTLCAPKRWAETGIFSPACTCPGKLNPIYKKARLLAESYLAAAGTKLTDVVDSAYVPTVRWQLSKFLPVELRRPFLIRCITRTPEPTTATALQSIAPAREVSKGPTEENMKDFIHLKFRYAFELVSSYGRQGSFVRCADVSAEAFEYFTSMGLLGPMSLKAARSMVRRVMEQEFGEVVRRERDQPLIVHGRGKGTGQRYVFIVRR